MSKQTLHFTLGDGLGAIMYDIAFDKLVHKNNFNAAIKSYTDSFPGMNVDLVKDIIIGKNVVVTNADIIAVPSIIGSPVEPQQCVKVNSSISGRKRKLFS